MQRVFRKLLYLSFALLLVFGAAPQLFAQSTGSIRGTVVDPSSAAIHGATVTVTNKDTGILRTTQTNESGLFVFPDLVIGSYSLKIGAAGFSTENRPGLQLLTGQTIDLSIALAVGSQTQVVTVTSETQAIETASSNVAQSVTQEQMQDLPLNGRNPLQLTTLTAGAVLTTSGTESGQQDNTGLSVNGLRATQNTYTLDGTIYVDRFFDSVPTMPSPDALQEFTIQASNYSANHAGAGALVQLSTRSGTSTLHGSAWEYFRNTVLNARNYFTSPTAAKPPFKLNQFGGTAGGPIFKSKKAFFFFSAEDLEQRSSPGSITIEVPTPAELTGDFSALLPLGTVIYDPVAGCPYGQTMTAGTCTGTITNKITTPMDPLSAAINKQYLAATEALASPASANYSALFSSTNNNIDSTQYLVKIDDAVTQNDHLSARYFYNQDNFQRPFTAPLGFYAANLFRNQTFTLSDAHVFSNTLTGSVYAGFFRGARTQIPEAPGLKTDKDLGQTINYGSPNESLIPFPGVRNNLTYINIFSGGALTQDSTTFDFSAEMVKLLNTHTLTFGGDIERTRIDADDYSFTPGDNTFNGGRTQKPASAVLPAGYKSSGDPFADFYTGYESTFYQDNGRKFYLRELRPSLFLQDDWKLGKKLTLNLGVRWDPWLPPVDLNNTLVGFNLANPTFQSTIAPGAPKGMMFNGDPGMTSTVYKATYKNFAPRVGFAYNVFGTGKTVVRGAYGIFYGFPEGLLYQRTDLMQPVDLYLNITNPAQWDNIYAGVAGGNPFPRGHVSQSQYAAYSFLLPVSGGVLDPAAKAEYTQDYNLTVEQGLGHNFALSLAYVGDHAEHIMASRQFNPTTFIPATGTTGAKAGPRLYPGLGAVEIAQSYEYEMTNSLQVNVTRRASHGLTLLSNFVWMKTIDNSSSGTEGNSGPPNPYNLNSARGVADFDQALRFTTSVNYVVPKFNVSHAAGQVINGWQANTIVAMQDGLPLTILSGVNNSLSGINNDYADYVPGVSTTRPAGVSKLTSWFNPAAFTKNATGTFGNVPRNSLRGPGFNNVDMSLFKEIMPERRVHAQFQAQAFNLFNHTNLANPGVNVNAGGSFGHITATSSSTGSVNIPSPVGTQRVMQFALKFMF
jgi:hypothetical protein